MTLYSLVTVTKQNCPLVEFCNTLLLIETKSPLYKEFSLNDA